MDYDPKDVQEDVNADFANFIAAKDWKGAQAIIDNLFDLEMEDDAVALRKALINAQAVV